MTTHDVALALSILCLVTAAVFFALTVRNYRKSPVDDELISMYVAVNKPLPRAVEDTRQRHRRKTFLQGGLALNTLLWAWIFFMLI